MNKLRRLLAIHGLSGTFKLLTAKVAGLILWATPARRRARAEARDRDLEFDRRWGVNTSGKLTPDESEVVGSSWCFGSRYQGVDSNSFEQILDELQINYNDYTLIDFGSGKGRAVLIASQYPFKKVIGVEYSHQLNESAKQNVAKFPSSQKKAKSIELVCADAVTYAIPQGPLVIFLYNPFSETIMEQLTRNVAASVQQEPRRVIVIYFYAVAADVWKRSGFVGVVRESRQISIFDTQVKELASKAA